MVNEEEEKFLEQFVELSQLKFTNYDLDNDPPDAKLELNGKVISLEISKLFDRFGERTIQEWKLIEEFKEKLPTLSKPINMDSFSVRWDFKFPINVKGKSSLCKS